MLVRQVPHATNSPYSFLPVQQNPTNPTAKGEEGENLIVVTKRAGCTKNTRIEMYSSHFFRGVRASETPRNWYHHTPKYSVTPSGKFYFCKDLHGSPPRPPQCSASPRLSTYVDQASRGQHEEFLGHVRMPCGDEAHPGGWLRFGAIYQTPTGSSFPWKKAGSLKCVLLEFHSTISDARRPQQPLFELR